MHIAPGQGQTTPLGYFSFSLTVLFSPFSPLLQVLSPLNDFVIVFPIQPNR